MIQHQQRTGDQHLTSTRTQLLLPSMELYKSQHFSTRKTFGEWQKKSAKVDHGLFISASLYSFAIRDGINHANCPFYCLSVSVSGEIFLPRDGFSSSPFSGNLNGVNEI